MFRHTIFYKLKVQYFIKKNGIKYIWIYPLSVDFIYGLAMLVVYNYLP